MANYLNWTGSAGSDTSVLADQTQLLMEPMLRAMYAQLDPFFRDMAVSSERVERASKMSRDWKILKPFKYGLRGNVSMDTTNTVYGPTVNAIGANQYTHSKANLNTFPNAFDSPSPIPEQIEIQLVGMRTSCPWPIAEDDFDALPADIGEAYPELMEGWARNIALYRVVHFYNSDDAGKICDIVVADISAAETYSDPQGSLVLTVPSKAINSFHRGAMIDVYQTSTLINVNTADERVPLYVEYVDHFKNQIKLVYSVTAASSGASGATGIIEAEGVDDGETISLYLKSSYGDAFPGLNTYCKATHITNSAHPNYFDSSAGFFGIDLQQYPEFSSLVVDAENNYLTEMLGSSALAYYADRHSQFGHDIDTCILRRGAHVGYLKARRGLERRNREGSNTAPLGGGTQGIRGGFAMTFDGITVTGYYSAYLREGNAHLIKKADGNFKRYVPPMGKMPSGGMPPGFGDADGLISALELEFMGKKTGHASEYVPIRDGDGEVVEGVQMLARSRMTVVPDQFSSIKIENIAEVEPTIVTS